MTMTEEQAYCCLTCRESAGCCKTCGECPDCCEDCGDMSSCGTTAYFGKDDKIYKGYTTTKFSWSTQYNWLSDREFSTQYINGILNSITNEKRVYGRSTFDSWLCGECLCGENPDTSYTKITTTYNGKTSNTFTRSKGACIDCEDCLGGNADYCFQCGCSCNKIFTQSSTGGVPSLPAWDPVDASAPDCGMLKDDTHDSGGTVEFIFQLKTYNSLGEVVEDPIPNPENPYNPCAPLRIAYAPACHFFAL